ncbi:MAG: disulfide bond formation protein B [Patescibacteria group bacterium]|jgi:disulfide bond formation protein DsbB
MDIFIYYFKEFLNYLTLIGTGIAVILLLNIIYLKATSKSSNWLAQLIQNKALLWVFIVSLIATLGSLFYSEIAGYQPCKLCWFQRIFMYPLPLLILMALIRKEIWIKPYALAMSVIGQVISLYHYFLQVGTLYNIPVNSLAPCSDVGVSISCTSFSFIRFGYITIPMMSFIAFSLITIILLTKTDKRN